MVILSYRRPAWPAPQAGHLQWVEGRGGASFGLFRSGLAGEPPRSRILFPESGADRRIQIDQDLVRRSAVVAMEVDKLIEDVTSVSLAGMAKHLPSGNDLVETAGEAAYDFHMVPARILSLRFPQGVQSREMMVAADEVVPDHQQNRSQATAAAANDRAVGQVDVGALMT